MGNLNKFLVEPLVLPSKVESQKAPVANPAPLEVFRKIKREGEEMQRGLTMFLAANV